MTRYFGCHAGKPRPLRIKIAFTALHGERLATTTGKMVSKRSHQAARPVTQETEYLPAMCSSAI